jgi:hypothetical protein
MTRALRVSTFHGSVPRRAAHLTPLGHAARAIDCRLDDGALASWRTPRVVDTLAPGVKSVHMSGHCCRVDSTCSNTSWAEGPAPLSHVFATQFSDKPWPVRIAFDDMCTPTVTRLGLPCPAERLDAQAPPEAIGKGTTPRQYIYRWRNAYCEESSPSPPSQQLLVADGTAVQLSGWVLPPAAEEWPIVQLAIYRSVSGFESATRVSENKIDAAWMLVDVIDAADVSYLDTKRDADLYEAMDDGRADPPPADLRGVVQVDGANTLVGFVGRDVVFSHNGQPGSWPYRLRLDDTVRGLAESGGVVYVATDGHPYVITGEASCDAAECRRVQRMPEALPLVGCCTSMSPVPGGAVYPSHDGLVLMSGNQAPRLITASHYAARDWQALHPDTVKAAYHMGRLFVFARNGAFILGVNVGATTNAQDTAHHTELSLRPQAAWVTRTGRLLLRLGDSVVEWDRGATLMPHRYESGDVLAGVPVGMGAAQVLMAPGDERLQVYVGGVLAADDTFMGDGVVSLPLWAVGQSFRFVLTGTAHVYSVSIAPSTKEL